MNQQSTSSTLEKPLTSQVSLGRYKQSTRKRRRYATDATSMPATEITSMIPAGEDIYRTLVKTSPDAIILVATTGVILVANAQAAKLHGFGSAEELCGQNVFDLIAHEEHQSAISQLGTTTEIGSLHNIEHMLLRIDGSSFPAELSMSVITDATGAPRAFIGIIRDITERKETQQKIEELLVAVQKSNENLAHAYETTLEGWSGALDLRDKETEGHSQRVTQLTVALATAMGMSAEEIVHLRRGALLHDIGKMGVPDAVLLKPGPLTDEEWQVMRMHPIYAHNLLQSIEFLHPALEIPYFHHEKWDGTGYPLGLKGADIPLGARIFAVADVWDALCSDRPYRSGWAREKVREHIRSQAGTHFDPAVVEAFLALDQLTLPQRSEAAHDTMELVEQRR